MKKQETKRSRQLHRHVRVRATISGTAMCPRLSVFRSLRGMYVQLIDDTMGKTLVSARAIEVKKGDAGDRAGKIAVAYGLGKLIAEKAKTAGIVKVVFDRGGYAYHGRVEAVAEGAREGGLQF